jgi:hypothetical protein
MLAYQQYMRWFQAKVFTAYFIGLTTGLCLYMYEYARRMPWEYGLLVYGLTLSWMLVNWFGFRPRLMRQHNDQMNEIIEQLTQLANQLEAGEKDSDQ